MAQRQPRMSLEPSGCIPYSYANDKSKQKSKRQRIIYAVAFFIYFGSAIAFYSGHENWRVLDALYFSVVVLTTVGYGDFIPNSDAAKVFTSFFVLFGVILVAVVLSQILADIFFSRQNEVKKNQAQRVHHLLKLHSIDEPLVVSRFQRVSQWLSTYAKKPFLTLVVFGSGVLVVTVHEKKTFGEALYFVCITCTTVGFGDVSFTSDVGKGFALLWIPLTTLVFSYWAGVSVEYVFGEIAVDSELEHKLSRDLFNLIDVNHDDSLTLDEWMAFVLVDCGYVDLDVLNAVKRRFHELDKDGGGTIPWKEFFVTSTFEFAEPDVDAAPTESDSLAPTESDSLVPTDSDCLVPTASTSTESEGLESIESQGVATQEFQLQQSTQSANVHPQLSPPTPTGSCQTPGSTFGCVVASNTTANPRVTANPMVAATDTHTDFNNGSSVDVVGVHKYPATTETNNDWNNGTATMDAVGDSTMHHVTTHAHPPTLSTLPKLRTRLRKNRVIPISEATEC
eukprot:m.227730 g.227730  ORF g.227730 m.227730 type:complete len:508 (+) comp33529_c0_seq18:306-1829(+)